MSTHFDVIVVGAGPAGSAAAITLAKAGVRVLCLERGEFPGAKNVSGGVLYGNVLEELLGAAAADAPLERRIDRHVVTLAGTDHHVSCVHQHLAHAAGPCAHSVLRNRFDRWLGEQARIAGARLLTEAPVDDLIRQGNRVAGVKVRRNRGEISSSVVILADGVNSLLAKRAGLRPAFQPGEMLLAAKEVIKLPTGVLASRFNLDDNGAAHVMVGEVTAGIEGGAFLYTNGDSLSLGLACYLDALVRERVRIHDLLERFKQIPWVAEFIHAGRLKEYAAHLIPVTRPAPPARLLGNGVMVSGDGAGLTLNNGFVLRGMDFAMASGQAAAQTALAALERGDFARKSLETYRTCLQDDFVLQDLKTFGNMPGIFRNRALYALYPSLLGGVLAEMFAAPGTPRQKPSRILWRQLRRHRRVTDIFKDSLELIRTL